MYHEESVVRPYARALVTAAMELDCMARVREDMAALKAQWTSCEALQTWAQTFRSLPRAQHRAEVDSLWGETMSEPVKVLLEALSTDGMLSAIPLVIQLFERLADRAQGRVQVVLTFAIAPTSAVVDRLTREAVEAYGPETKVSVVVDATLGAGMIVRAGHLQMDGSLTGRLRRLRKTFVSAK